MKSFLLLCFALVLSNLKAQDTLYFNNGEKKTILLLEVNPDNVKYKRWDNQAGATYTSLKSEVTHVAFLNGTKEVFDKKELTKTDVALADTAKTKPQTADTKKPDDFFSGSQPDTLVFRSGKRTAVKVLIVNEKEVKYKLWSFQDGPTYAAAKYELRQVNYGNGRVENFSENSKPAVSPYSVSTGAGNNQSMYQKGKSDAVQFYRHGGGAGWVGCAATGCGPLIALIPAVIVTNHEPKPENLGMPRAEYANNVDYQRGYAEQAYKMKKKKVWTGYGIGTGVLVVIYIVAYILSM